MNFFFRICFLLIFLSFSTLSVGKGVVFYDAGNEEYNTYSTYKIFTKKYGQSVANIIVLATSSGDNKKFIAQHSILEEMTALETKTYNFLYIVANSARVDKDSYYTDTKTAKEILGDSDFKICIYNRKGELTKISKNIINKQSLISILNRNTKFK